MDLDENLIHVRTKMQMYEDKYYDAIFEDRDEDADKYYQMIKHCEKLLKEGVEYEPKF